MTNRLCGQCGSRSDCTERDLGSTHSNTKDIFPQKTTFEIPNFRILILA